MSLKSGLSKMAGVVALDMMHKTFRNEVLSTPWKLAINITKPESSHCNGSCE